MKLLNSNTQLPATRNPSPDSDLQPKTATKPTRRKGIPAGTRLRRRSRTPVGKGSRPETPLLKWTTEAKQAAARVDDDARDGGRKNGREGAVSVRKLGALLWRLQLPDVDNGDSGVDGSMVKENGLGFQPCAGHVGVQNLTHCDGDAYGSEAKDLLQSPKSIDGTKNGYLCKVEPSLKFSSTTMEGATKWDPVFPKPMDEARHVYGYIKPTDQRVSAVPIVSALEAELEQARSRIHELEIERRSSKKKLEHFLKKVSEERTAWRSREHEKIRVFIDDLKADLNREKKNRQRLEIVNSKLVNELAEAKLSVKRFMQDYEKERKTRELIEEVCDELAKEIGEDKAELEELKREATKFQEEVEDERKMLQMAEVWREERVQMKLVDAKLALEEKYSQMNMLVAELEEYLKSRSATPDVKELQKLQFLGRAVASVNIQDFQEFEYEPPNPDEIFSVFEDVNFGECNEREIKPCDTYSPASHASKTHSVTPEVNMIEEGIQRHSNAICYQNREMEDDESGWETVSHMEDQGSCYSPEESAPSVIRSRRDSNVSASGTEWEENVGRETPVTEISEISSLPVKQFKKPSIGRLWRTCSNNKNNYKVISLEGGRLSNGRMSNASFVSLDCGSGKDGLSPSDMVLCSSPESGNPHASRGRTGCIEWPRGMQKHSLKAKLMEARMGGQKVQLRQVLKQKF